MGGEYRAYSFILKGFVTTCICGSSLTFPSKITKLPQLITVLQTACFLFPVSVSIELLRLKHFTVVLSSASYKNCIYKIPVLSFTRGECHWFGLQVFSRIVPQVVVNVLDFLCFQYPVPMFVVSFISS